MPRGRFLPVSSGPATPRPTTIRFIPRSLLSAKVDRKLGSEVNSERSGSEDGKSGKGETAPATQQERANSPPNFWHVREQYWNDLPEAVQRQTLKREQDACDSVSLLRRKYET
jgi:hypothetical protein